MMSAITFHPFSKSLQRVALLRSPYILSLFGMWLTLPCLQASQYQRDEKKDEDDEKGITLVTKKETPKKEKGLDFTELRISLFLQRVAVAKSYHISSVLLKAFLEEEKNWKHVLKTLSRKNNYHCEEDAFIIYRLIESMVDEGLLIDQETMGAILDIYSRLMNYASGLIDIEKRQKLFGFFCRHFALLLHHKKKGSFFQKHKGYLAICKRYTEEVARDPTLQDQLKWLSPKEKNISTIVRYIPLDTRNDKSKFFSVLDKQMRCIATYEGLGELGDVFEEFIYFKKLLRAKNKEENEMVLNHLKVIEKQFNRLLKLYTQGAQFSFCYEKPLIYKPLLTFLKLLSDQPLGKEMAINMLFKCIRILDIVHLEKAFSIVFESHCPQCTIKGCADNQKLVYDHVKNFLLQKECALLNQGYIGIMVPLFWRALSYTYRRALMEEKLPVAISLHGEGKLLCTASPGLCLDDMESISEVVENQIELLSCEGQIERLMTEITTEKGITLDKLEKRLKGIALSITTSPMWDLSHNLIDGFLREEDMEDRMPDSIFFLLKSFIQGNSYSLEELFAVRFLRLTELYTWLYDEGSMPIKKMVFTEFMDFDIWGFCQYSSDSMLREVIWERWAKMLSSYLAGDCEFSMSIEKNPLAIFSSNFGKDKQWHRKRNILLDLDCDLQAHNVLIEKILKNWKKHITQHQLHDAPSLIAGVEIFHKFSAIFEQKPSYLNGILDALEKLLKLPNTEQYLFQDCAKVFNVFASNTLINKKFLVKVAEIWVSHAYSNPFKKKILQGLVHYNFNAQAIGAFFLAMVKKSSDTLIRSLINFLGKWLATEEKKASFIAGLYAEENVDDFLSLCSTQSEVIKWLPCAPTFWKIQNTLIENKNTLKN